VRNVSNWMCFVGFRLVEETKNVNADTFLGEGCPIGRFDGCRCRPPDPASKSTDAHCRRKETKEVIINDEVCSFGVLNRQTRSRGLNFFIS